MTTQRAFSKSKLVAYRQCPKRLWLEIHRPKLRVDAPGTEAVFRTGHEVGRIALRIYDPVGSGTEVDFRADDVPAALERTRELLRGDGPVFEAGLAADGVLAVADVMLSVEGEAGPGWRIVEVKSSTSVKPYQEEDAAIQAHVARAAGIDLRGIAVAHVDTSWVYPGNGDYRGLLIERDLTERVLPRSDEVRAWIAEAQMIASADMAPDVPVGPQCKAPFQCSFLHHCSAGRPVADFPLEWLPGRWSRALTDFIEETGTNDLRFVPDDLLNDLQRRVRDATVSGTPYFDRAGAKDALAPFPPPAYFLDFETIQFGVPRHAGTRPYQMLPFQFSLHRLSEDGQLDHSGFLDLTGGDPSEAFARRLVEVCAEPLPIFVYNATFERTRIAELADRFSAMAPALGMLSDRIVDLLPITRNHFYHPAQHGSWSIKAVLPVVADLDYAALSGVKDGEQAMEAYLEAIDPATPPERKNRIRHDLDRYCALDTEAMVALWQFLSGVGEERDYR